MTYRAIAFDGFGTLLRATERRVNAYQRLANLGGGSRLPFLTRNVPISTFASELGQSHMLELIERELREEVAAFEVYGDVPPLLRELRGRGIKTALCSNLAASYRDAVRALLPTLDVYVFSSEVGFRKPDPQIYRHLCEALRCKPRDVLFVGDSKRADFEGPLDFGMAARLISRPGQSLRDVVFGGGYA